MVNTNELLCVVDEFDTPIEPKPRHKVFKDGDWRRTAHVWIINDRGQVLCQKRSMRKDISPGKWEPAIAGHLSAGDNYFTGAVREIYEETGISVDPSDLQLVKIYKDNTTREYRGIFYCKCNTELHKIKREVEEVEEVKFIKVSTLKKYLTQNKNSWVTLDYKNEMLSALS